MHVLERRPLRTQDTQCSQPKVRKKEISESPMQMASVLQLTMKTKETKSKLHHRNLQHSLQKRRRIEQLDTTLSVSLKSINVHLRNETLHDFESLTIIWCSGRSLGSGTFGKVRIGTHTITGEKVAIKILEKDRIKDKGDVERVTREINILKKVRHPNVIQLYEVSIQPARLAIYTNN